MEGGVMREEIGRAKGIRGIILAGDKSRRFVCNAPEQFFGCTGSSHLRKYNI
jgi:hypothetical protein